MAPRVIDDWRTALRALKANWNSYGSQPITEAAIEAMANFYVVPASDGGIQLEAHFGGKDFELDISPGGKMKAMFLADGVDPETAPSTADKTPVEAKEKGQSGGNDGCPDLG